MNKTNSAALVFTCLFSISAFATQIKCGDYVIEDYRGRSIQKVINISSDGDFQLEDMVWFLLY